MKRKKLSSDIHCFVAYGLLRSGSDNENHSQINPALSYIINSKRRDNDSNLSDCLEECLVWVLFNQSLLDSPSDREVRKHQERGKEYY